MTSINMTWPIRSDGSKCHDRAEATPSSTGNDIGLAFIPQAESRYHAKASQSLTYVRTCVLSRPPPAVM